MGGSGRNGVEVVAGSVRGMEEEMRIETNTVEGIGGEN